MIDHDILIEYTSAAFDNYGRITREALHLTTAVMWSCRSPVERMKVGAVITSNDMKRILSIGYNGVASGLPHNHIRPNPGDSGTIHAEVNALAMADCTIPNKIMFCTHSPCETCAQLIVNAGFECVYYLEVYRDLIGIGILETCGVKCKKLKIFQHQLSQG